MSYYSLNYPSITLASASSRRCELLDQIQVSYIACPVSIDESQIEGEIAIQLGGCLRMKVVTRESQFEADFVQI